MTPTDTQHALERIRKALSSPSAQHDPVEAPYAEALELALPDCKPETLEQIANLLDREDK